MNLFYGEKFNLLSCIIETKKSYKAFICSFLKEKTYLFVDLWTN